MGSYFGPQEPQAEVTLERYYLATEFISGIGYGTQAVLYFICTHYLWNQRKARRINMFMLAYITLLFFISSIAQVAQAHRAQLVFIDNRNFPGGPWGYYRASTGGMSNMVGQTANAVLLFLSELFMILVIWYSVGLYTTYYAVALLPLLMLLTGLIAAILDLFSIVHPTLEIAGTHKAWALTYYTLMFGTNILVTALILIRLITHRRSVQKSLMHAHAMDYTSVITILIESSFFYSIVGAACLVISGLGIPVSSAFVCASISVQQISGYLIIVRVANGRALDTSVLSSKFVARRPGSPSETSMSDEEQGALAEARN